MVFIFSLPPKKKEQIHFESVGTKLVLCLEVTRSFFEKKNAMASSEFSSRTACVKELTWSQIQASQ